MIPTRHTRLVWQLLAWVLVGTLLWFVVREIDWPTLVTVLAGLVWQQVLVLLLVNGGIVLLLGARWWLLLRARGYRIRLLDASAYRLAAFSISYFTPGPQFGGEPLQVYLAVRREGIPAGPAAASVALDRVLELASNFAFLAFGTVMLLSGGLVDVRTGTLSIFIATSFLLLPVFYLGLLLSGRSPFTRIGHALPPVRRRGWIRAIDFIGAAEMEVARFIATRRFTFFLAVLLSGIVWAALVAEYVLAARFLGLTLNFQQVVSVMTAARVAMLLPMPGGLGTLEAALVLATQALGEGAAVGAGLSLLIRARDLLFGLLGLWLGRRLAA